MHYNTFLSTLWVCNFNICKGQLSSTIPLPSFVTLAYVLMHWTPQHPYAVKTILVMNHQEYIYFQAQLTIVVLQNSLLSLRFATPSMVF